MTTSLDEEQEVDLSSAWQRLKLRWWLPVGGLVIGAVVGIALALSGGTVWRSQTIVYLGQPFAPLGGGQIQSLATNPRTVGEIIRSEAALKRASEVSGIPVSRLRSSISTRELLAAGQLRGINPLMEITVKGSGKRKVELAAAALARRVTERVSVYVTEKVALLESDVETAETQLDEVNERIRSAQVQQAAVLADRSLPLDQRLLVTANLNSVVTTADARRAAIQDEPLRVASAPQSRGERGVESRRRAGGGEQDHSAVEPLVAARRGAHRPDPRRHRRARCRPDRRPPARDGSTDNLMLDGKRVAVVVPAFDEEWLVGETIRGIPEFVDRIIVVDDASRDGTSAAAEAAGDARVQIICHERNAGVGAAIATGYRRALEEEMDVTCVMAADNQMDPSELEELAGPVARGEVEYAKANRLVSGEAWKVIPRTRYLGNAVLSLLTKIASGYWHVADSQAGYTALSLNALRRLDLDALYPRYGFPNDVLVHLNIQNARVRDVPSRPIYDVGERSGIKLRSVVPRISWLLLKGFWWRMGQKYVIRDFHPLVFFYVFGVLMLGVGLVLGLVELALRIAGNAITPATIVLVAVLLIAGLQMTLFAMWFDMEANKDLR